MNIVHLNRRLWQAYLQSATGTMRSLVKPRQQSALVLTAHRWTLPVASLMRTKRGTDLKGLDEIDHRTYMDFIQRYLSDLDERSQCYRTQFNTITNQLNNYSEMFSYQIDMFVSRTALVTARLHFDARIALIKHAYTDRLLQLEFRQSKPSDNHVGFLFAPFCFRIHSIGAFWTFLDSIREACLSIDVW